MGKQDLNTKKKSHWDLPDDWEIKRLKEIAEIDKDSLSAKTPAGYLFDYISLSDIDSDKLEMTTTKQVFENAPSRARRIVSKGDVLLSTVRPGLQGFVHITKEVKDLIASTGFSVITPFEEDGEYIYQYLFSTSISKQFYSLLVGSNYPAINSSDVRNLKIAYPPKIERKKIAAILHTWDNTINKTQQLITQLEQRNKGLMQELLTGKRRLKGFNGEWRKRNLSECLIPTVREVKKPNAAFLALGIRSHGKGVFHKVEFEPEDIEMETLYEVRENDLIVNITFAWEQAIAIAGQEDNGGLVSHRFPTYTFVDGVSCVDFFRYLVIQKSFKYLLDLISPGGAGRNRVMSKKDFLKLEVQIPDIKEQEAIGKILKASVEEQKYFEKKLSLFQTQKKGLLQKLLTGELRVTT